MSRGAMVNDLVRAQARALKMPGLARAFEALVRQVREERWTHEDYLHEVLAAEVTSREDSAARHRLQEARFPEVKTLDSFDFDAVDGIDRALVAHLAKATWIDERKNLILAGPIGTGKTHLAIALGVEATRLRRRVVFHRAADLVRLLVEAKHATDLGRLTRKIQRADLLILDELGFVPFDRTGGELLFNVLADRYERRSTLVTTNLAFSEWPKVFGDDEKLTAALLDRLASSPTAPRSSRPRARATGSAESCPRIPRSLLRGIPPRWWLPYETSPRGGSVSDRPVGQFHDGAINGKPRSWSTDCLSARDIGRYPVQPWHSRLAPTILVSTKFLQDHFDFVSSV